MSYESDMRRQMESQAAQNQVQPQCPIEGDIDAEMSIGGFFKGIGHGIKRAGSMIHRGASMARRKVFGPRKHKGFK